MHLSYTQHLAGHVTVHLRHTWGLADTIMVLGVALFVTLVLWLAEWLTDGAWPKRWDLWLSVFCGNLGAAIIYHVCAASLIAWGWALAAGIVLLVAGTAISLWRAVKE